MYWIANLTLIFSILGCILTHIFRDTLPFSYYLMSFFEAATVGAVADWFAVTALFRRPLGLPVPHTAIIPRNKDRLGKALGQFIEKNFLEETAIEKKMSDKSLTSMLISWLESEGRIPYITAQISQRIPEFAKTLKDEKFKSYLAASSHDIFSRIKLTSIFREILSFTAKSKSSAPFIDEILKFSLYLVEEHNGFLKNTLGKELPWYIPKFIHEKIYQKMIGGLQMRLEAAILDKNHSLRKSILSSLSRFKEELESDSELNTYIQKFEEIIKNSGGIKNGIALLWDEVLDTVEHCSRDDLRGIEDSLGNIVTVLIVNIKKDAKIVHSLDEKGKRVVLALLHRYRHSFSLFVADTISSWDSRTVTEKIEKEIGKDLQYIRLNGTVVGGLAGMAVAYFTKFLE